MYLVCAGAHIVLLYCVIRIFGPCPRAAGRSTRAAAYKTARQKASETDKYTLNATRGCLLKYPSYWCLDTAEQAGEQIILRAVVVVVRDRSARRGRERETRFHGLGARFDRLCEWPLQAVALLLLEPRRRVPPRHRGQTV